eukprot:COSAG02_NODE_1773_length_10980_cov_8.196765_5_plen_131_part_00
MNTVYHNLRSSPGILEFLEVARDELTQAGAQSDGRNIFNGTRTPIAMRCARALHPGAVQGARFGATIAAREGATRAARRGRVPALPAHMQHSHRLILALLLYIPPACPQPEAPYPDTAGWLPLVRHARAP